MLVARTQSLAQASQAAAAALSHRAVFPPSRRSCSRRAAQCFANAENGNVSVSFQLPYRCKFGQQLCLVGDSKELGAWDVAEAVPMTWTDGDVWVVDMQLTPDGGATVEYKYVVCSVSDLSQAVRWKEGGNFSLRVPAQGGRLRVRDSWDESQREVEIEVVQPAGSEAPQRRPRRRRSASDDEAEVTAALSKAADKALGQLDAAVERSLGLRDESVGDLAAPELLAADRVVAAAARRAATMTRALDAVQETKLLPPSSDGGKPAAAGTRRRRAGSKEQQQEQEQ